MKPSPITQEWLDAAEEEIEAARDAGQFLLVVALQRFVDERVTAWAKHVVDVVEARRAS